MDDEPIVDAPVVDAAVDYPVFVVSQLCVMGDDNAGAGIPATPGECPTCGPTTYNPKSMRNI